MAGAGGGYNVEASFDVQDKISKKLVEIIAKLDKAQAAMDKASAAMMKLGAMAEYAATAFNPLNDQLALTVRRVGQIADQGNRSASSINNMASAATRGASAFASMNRQMDQMHKTAMANQRAFAAQSFAGAAAGAAGGAGGGGARRPGALVTLAQGPGGVYVPVRTSGHGGGGNTGGPTTTQIFPRSMGGGAGGGQYGGGGGFGLGGIMGMFNNPIGKALNAMIGFDVLKAGMHPAMEYEQAKTGLAGMGVTDKQMRQAEITAAKMSREIPSTNRTENLTQIKEMFGILRKFPEAIELAPDFAKFAVALQGMGKRVPGMKGHEDTFAQAALKSAESLGQLKPNDFRKFLNNSLASYEATGGLVNPLQTAQAIKFSRGARYGKSDDWTFGVMSFLLEEAALGKGGGGSRGVGPLVTGLDKSFGIGAKMDKRMIQNFAQMGLFEGAPANQKASGTGFALNTTTMSSGVTAKIRNQNMMVENPYEWFKGTFYPAMFRAEKITRDQFEKMPQKDQAAMIKSHTMGMDKVVGDAVLQFGINRQQIDLFLEGRKRAMQVEQAYAETQKTTAMHAKNAGQALYNLGLQIGTGLMPASNIALDGIQKLASALGNIGSTFPEMSSAVGRLNEQLFGAEGRFKNIGDSLQHISDNSGPLLALVDKIGALVISGTGSVLNPTLKGINKGLNNATRLERQTNGLVPAWATGGTLAGLGMIDEQAQMAPRISDRMGRQLNDTADRNADRAHVQSQADFDKTPNLGQIIQREAGRVVSQAGAAINIYFQGPVVDMKQLTEKVQHGINMGLNRAAQRHQATVGKAGGNISNPTS